MTSFQSLIYAIVPVVDFDMAKQNMVRASVNTDIASLNKSDDGLNVMVMFVKEFSTAFASYEWLSHNDMLSKLDDSAWSGVTTL